MSKPAQRRAGRGRAEEELTRLVSEARLLEGLSDSLRDMIARVQAYLAELRTAGSTLENLAGQEGVEVLVPIGAGSLVKASIREADKVIVSLGADVAVEVDVEKAKEIIGSRLAEAQRALQDYVARLREVERALSAYRERIRSLLEERGLAGGPEERPK